MTINPSSSADAMQQENSADIPDRIIGLLESKGRSILLTRSKHVYRIEFENQKRIILNFNPAQGVIWMADGLSSAEFTYRDGRWLSKLDSAELLQQLNLAIQQSLPEFDVQAKKLAIIDAPLPATGQVYARSEAARDTGLRPYWALLAVLGTVFFVGFAIKQGRSNRHPASTVSQAVSTQQARASMAAPACDADPPVNGSRVDAQTGSAGNTGKLPLEISNQHHFDMLIALTAPDSATPVQTIYVRSKSTVTASIPAGTYQLMFSVGRSWCSFQYGFKDGSLQKMQQSLSFLPETPSLLSLQPSGVKADQFTVFVRNEPEIQPDQTRQTVLSDGSVDIQQASDGHYYLRGFVNETAVNFLLDTGASRTFITYNAAMQAGIRDCQPAIFNTANGKVNGCIGVIPELRFGPFVIRNAVVSTAQKNNDVNLLGMDMLGKLQVSSNDGVMHLSKH